MASSIAPPVELVVEGRRRQRLSDALREFWAFREVVLAFTERDIRVKYKQAALGVAWAVLQPLAFLLIFTLVFSRFAGMSGGRAAYPASALAALVPWFFLQTAVGFGAQALLMDGALLRKIYFPREAPVLAAVLSAALDFVIGLTVLVLLAPLVGAHLSWTIVMVLPLWLMLALLASGVALALGALNVYYRDFRYALPLLLQLWMFASPVAYPISTVPERWQWIYLAVNPAAGVLEGFRAVLAEGRLPDPQLILFSLGGTLLILIAGLLTFKTLEPGFADTI